MNVGEIWAYRERNIEGAPPVPAEILQLGPPKAKKARVRFLAGEYPGLDQWVPKSRLKVPWAEAEDWLRDEERYAAVREASEAGRNTPEHEAAWLAFYVSPRPDDPYIEHPGFGAPPVLEVADLPAVAADLGLDPKDLLAEPLAFVDRHGTYVAPWPVALRLARRVAEVYPELVLAKAAEEERDLREKAVGGNVVELGRGDERFIPSEFYAEQLRQRQPVFALVRSWCGAGVVGRWDEAAALRAEVKRLRALVEEAARWLEEGDRPGLARKLRKDLGVPEQRRSLFAGLIRESGSPAESETQHA